MSEHDEVTRWSADAEAPAPMRALLRAVADDGPTPEELASLRRRVAPLLASPHAPVPAGRWVGRVPLVVVGAIVVGLAGYALHRWHAASDDTRAHDEVPIGVASVPSPAATPLAPTPTAAPLPAAPTPAAPTPAAPTPAAPTLRPLSSLPARAPAHVASRPLPPPMAPAAVAHAAPPAVTPPSAQSEVEMLEHARGLLRDGDAEGALASTAEHERLFPDGSLVEEREALAIEALVKLGRVGDARIRWSKFASAYPRSNYSARLQHVMEPRTSP